MDTKLPLIILLGTIGILIFSWWASIKEKRYHGIYRFFSFESIFILILLNSKYWFFNPFSLPQLMSWTFLLISLFIALFGFYILHKRGKPEGRIENTTKLVDTGLYRFIRHPLYLSLFLLGIGALLKRIGYIQMILVVINTVALILTAKVEEKEMISRFGEEYKEYMKKTKMFLPFTL